MKKKGFTLSEVLIALCIIGVISAIMASAFNQAKPDKTKMMYIKAYDALTTAVGAMVNDSSLFAEYLVLNPGAENESTLDISAAPLLDTAQPTNPYYYNTTGLDGENKFARLLCYALKGEVRDNNDNKECNECMHRNFYNDSGNPSFTTGPGNIEWWVRPVVASYPFYYDNNSKVLGTHVINLKIDGRDVGGFCVQPNGGIRIIGETGAQYIRNRRNVRSQYDRDAQEGTFNTPGESECPANPYKIENNIVTENKPSNNP